MFPSEQAASQYSGRWQADSEWRQKFDYGVTAAGNRHSGTVGSPMVTSTASWVRYGKRGKRGNPLDLGRRQESVHFISPLFLLAPHLNGGR